MCIIFISTKWGMFVNKFLPKEKNVYRFNEVTGEMDKVSKTWYYFLVLMKKIRLLKLFKSSRKKHDYMVRLRSNYANKIKIFSNTSLSDLITYFRNVNIEELDFISRPILDIDVRLRESDVYQECNWLKSIFSEHSRGDELNDILKFNDLQDVVSIRITYLGGTIILDDLKDVCVESIYR